MTPPRRPTLYSSAEGIDAVAWRTPSADRFDGRPANDEEGPTQSPSGKSDDVSGWLTVIVGGVLAAATGAMLGGALHI